MTSQFVKYQFLRTLRATLGTSAAFLTFALLFFFPTQLIAESIDPQNNDRQYAWSENGGWVNGEPLGNGGPGMEIGSGTTTGWLWSENFGWISLNCANTNSCGNVAFGITAAPADGMVDHYEFGGYAWGENIGWISFSCENTASCATVDYGVIVSDLGVISGYAWSENAGWISFDCANTSSCASVDFGMTTSLPVPLPEELLKDGFEDL